MNLINKTASYRRGKSFRLFTEMIIEKQKARKYTNDDAINNLAEYVLGVLKVAQA